MLGNRGTERFCIVWKRYCRVEEGNEGGFVGDESNGAREEIGRHRVDEEEKELIKMERHRQFERGRGTGMEINEKEVGRRRDRGTSLECLSR